MKVAFWSNVHGQTCTTANALAFSVMVALKHPMRVLLTHNHYHHSTLEYTLFGRARVTFDMTDFEDAGIDAVSRFIKYDELDSQCIPNYATNIIKQRLDFLPGTKHVHEDFYYQDLNEVIELILERAKKVYDLSVIDVSAGENELTNKILTSADLVVVNLNQNPYVLDDFFTNHYSNLKHVLLIISRYDDQSQMHIKRIKQKYNIKEPIEVLPYASNFADALGSGNTIDFLARNLSADSKDVNHKFMYHLEMIMTKILKQLDVVSQVGE